MLRLQDSSHQEGSIEEEITLAQRADFWPIIALNYPDLGEIHASPRKIEIAKLSLNFN